jgi:hypothetical protein
MTARDQPTQGHGTLFRVETDGIVDWLATATDSAGRALADTYGLADYDTFRRGGEGMHDRIPVLVDQAQSDAILYSADYDVVLWQLTCEGFLLTLDGPTPPRLCSSHLTVGDLVPERTSGIVAAVAVLMSVAQIANQLLIQRRPTRAAMTANTAFPRFRQGAPVEPAPMTTSTSPTDSRPHHGR